MPKNSEIAAKAVKERIAGNSKHGWGVEDSLAVIVAVIMNENGIEKVEDMDKVEFIDVIRGFINPSQFRQRIEGTEEEVKEGKALLVKGEGRKTSKGIMKELGLD